MTLSMCWCKSVFVLWLVGAADSAANTATTVSNFRLTGNTVTAFFDATDPFDACVVNTVFFSASDLTEKVSSGGNTSIFETSLNVFQTDICQDTIIFSAQQTVASEGTLKVSGNLESAAVTTAAIPVQDSISGTIFIFQINLTWQAIGKPESVHVKETVVTPEGVKFTAQIRETTVEAVATGSVLAAGMNFTPQASDSATIEKKNDISLVKEKTK